MSFLWSQQSIRWFSDACSYTNFHKKLAERIIPFLKPDDTLCDVGCGLGKVDLEIASFVSSITAVDVDEKVINELRNSAADAGIKNINAYCGDAFKLTETFDVIIMSFFGKSGKGEMEFHFNNCRRKLIRIVNAANRGRLYPGRRQTAKDTVSTVRRELIDKGRSFGLINCEIELGQPLRSWNDAANFVSYNAPDVSSEEIQDFLHTHIIETGRETFPLYLPNLKEIGIFIISKEDKIENV